MIKILLIIILIHVLLIGTGINELISHEVFDCLLTWSLLFSWSLLAFWIGAKPYAKLPDFKRSYKFAMLSLAVGFLLIPTLSIVTWTFPPSNFSIVDTLIAFVGFVMALFGPTMPRILSYSNQIRLANIQQREILKKQKKRKHGRSHIP